MNYIGRIRQWLMERLAGSPAFIEGAPEIVISGNTIIKGPGLDDGKIEIMYFQRDHRRFSGGVGKSKP